MFSHVIAPNKTPRRAEETTIVTLLSLAALSKDKLLPLTGGKPRHKSVQHTVTYAELPGDFITTFLGGGDRDHVCEHITCIVTTSRNRVFENPAFLLVLVVVVSRLVSRLSSSFHLVEQRQQLRRGGPLATLASSVCDSSGGPPSRRGVTTHNPLGPVFPLDSTLISTATAASMILIPTQTTADRRRRRRNSRTSEASLSLSISGKNLRTIRNHSGLFS